MCIRGSNKLVTATAFLHGLKETSQQIGCEMISVQNYDCLQPTTILAYLGVSIGAFGGFQVQPPPNESVRVIKT